LGTGTLRRIEIKDVFYKYEWPGMVMAYRMDWALRNHITEICTVIPHDFLLSAKAAEAGVFYQLDEKLAWHRRHGDNVGGEEHRITKLLNKQRKLKEIEDYLSIVDVLAKEEILKTPYGREALEQKRSFMQGRRAALLSGNIGKVLKNAWAYRGEVRPATVICDLLICKES